MLRIFKKKSRIFKNLNFFTKLKTFKTHFLKNFIIHKLSLWSLDVPQKKLGPIVSAILTFIGYKQTDTQTNRQMSQI